MFSHTAWLMTLASPAWVAPPEALPMNSLLRRLLFAREESGSNLGMAEDEAAIGRRKQTGLSGLVQWQGSVLRRHFPDPGHLPSQAGWSSSGPLVLYP